jgi:hypothetical protein
MDGKRLLRLLLLGAALVVAMILARQWPKDQTVHYVLGDGATRVEEVDARWAPGATSATADDWTREATFRYAPGQAPRIVTHEPRLPDGDYTVEIEIASASGPRSVARRHVTLSGGGSTSIDLADSVPR